MPIPTQALRPANCNALILGRKHGTPHCDVSISPFRQLINFASLLTNPPTQFFFFFVLFDQPIMAPAGDDHYHPKDAVSVAVKAGAVTGAAGVFMAAIQNALAKEHVGAWAVLSRGGGIIVSMAAVGGIYEFSRTASANLREKEDPWNTAIGGFLGGAVLGLRSMTLSPLRPSTN